MKNYRLLAGFMLLIAIVIAAVSACKKDGDQPGAGNAVSFTFDNRAGAKAIALDGTLYATASGETFTVSTLEYYVSNIVFGKADGSTYVAPGEYHLVNAARPSTTAFTVGNVPAGDYTTVSFVVGVDSATTKADPLSLPGDLNPANNMYWVWATGHIFMKLEGTVTSAANKALTCHIGGYRQPYSAIVTATPSLNGTTLAVRADHAPTVQLAADVLKLFDGPTKFSLSNFPTTMAPSPGSVQVARNYAAGMFTVKGIVAN